MEPQDYQESHPTEDTLVPMKSHPGLQALTWLGGIAAGFGVFVSLVTLVPSRTSGATRAGRAKWRQWREGPAKAAVAPASDASHRVSTTKHADDGDRTAAESTRRPPP
jgi:hypothetical protein